MMTFYGFGALLTTGLIKKNVKPIHQKCILLKKKQKLSSLDVTRRVTEAQGHFCTCTKEDETQVRHDLFNYLCLF